MELLSTVSKCKVTSLKDISNQRVLNVKRSIPAPSMIIRSHHIKSSLLIHGHYLQHLILIHQQGISSDAWGEKIIRERLLVISPTKKKEKYGLIMKR
jgi:hypothetical protein